MNEVALIVLASLAASALLLGAALCLAARRADDAATELLLPLSLAPSERAALKAARYHLLRSSTQLLSAAGTRTPRRSWDQVERWRADLHRMVMEMNVTLGTPPPAEEPPPLLPISVVLGERWPA